MLTAVRLLDLTDLRCQPDGPKAESLAAFLDLTKTRLKAFAQQVSAHYLARVQATPHFSTILSDREP
jgi:hypothetical protein